eukprot:282077-Pelagomonas_calceolata.AAC.2
MKGGGALGGASVCLQYVRIRSEEKEEKEGFAVHEQALGIASACGQQMRTWSLRKRKKTCQVSQKLCGPETSSQWNEQMTKDLRYLMRSRTLSLSMDSNGVEGMQRCGRRKKAAQGPAQTLLLGKRKQAFNLTLPAGSTELGCKGGLASFLTKTFSTFKAVGRVQLSFLALQSTHFR